MAKKNEEKILNQTKGTFRLIGKITGTERDNFFTSRILERGKMKGKEMRSLRFGVKTSNQQTVYVQMTGYEPETVYLWNTKEKDKSKRSSKMSYDDYLDQKEALEEDGIIHLIQQLVLQKQVKMRHVYMIQNLITLLLQKNCLKMA